jgi:hypothetical protein
MEEPAVGPWVVRGSSRPRPGRRAAACGPRMGPRFGPLDRWVAVDVDARSRAPRDSI